MDGPLEKIKCDKRKSINHCLFLYPGGADDLEHLPVSDYQIGIVGCVGQLSVGQIYDVNLLHRAKNGRNIDNCQDDNESQQSLLLSVP
jgi:hypothetical protein